MSNLSMKNVIIGSVLAVAAVTSLSVNAAENVCSGGAAGDGKKFTAGTNFVKQEFTPKCSANVFMQGEEVSATIFAAGAASAKGKYYFGGSTVGGAVGNLGQCAGSPPVCDNASATSAITKAKEAS